MNSKERKGKNQKENRNEILKRKKDGARIFATKKMSYYNIKDGQKDRLQEIVLDVKIIVD